jgi:chromatin assembly factor 1 subunit A
MDDIVSSPASPQNRKRSAPDETSPSKKPLNLKGTQFMMPTPPDTDHSNNTSPANGNVRAASPAPSSSTLSSIQEVESNPDTSSNANAGATSNTPRASGTGQPPAKRRKLTLSEKIEQQRAKEVKAAERAEQKARKDEEKRVKDEERRLKAEEREARKREKDLEEERKNQDKLKKERSQMRLGAFFQKPATPAKTQSTPDNLVDSDVRARRRSLSLETYDDIADEIRRSASPSKAAKGTPNATQPAKPAKPSQLAVQQTPSMPLISDYRKHFLPFDLQSHTVLAPLRHADRSSDDNDKALASFDTELHDPTLQEKYDLGLVPSYAGIQSLFPAEQRGYENGNFLSARQIVEQIHGSSSQQPIDLTHEKSSRNPVDLLQSLPLRYLHFAEDVRPPYFGTYTKIRSSRSSRRLSRNPFARERDDTNYDYDSEAEWEEPEEGEDLLNDEDDEAESNSDPDEMDEFLDDEHDEMRNKRKMITGDLLPVSTGLCWQDEKQKVIPSTERDEGASDLSDMRMEFMIPGFTGKTIDPFSTAYWEPTIMPPPGVPVRDSFGLSRQAARQPLKERHNTNSAIPDLVGAAEGEKGPITSLAATLGDKRGRKPAPRVLSKGDMEEFKDAVVGSALKKADLSKGLKSR